MIPLSVWTQERLQRVFVNDANRSAAARLLEIECADNLPLLGGPATPVSLERIRFAVLKLSEGTMEGLRTSIELAQADWRDLLMAAGFGDNVTAHEEWSP